MHTFTEHQNSFLRLSNIFQIFDTRSDTLRVLACSFNLALRIELLGFVTSLKLLRCTWLVMGQQVQQRSKSGHSSHLYLLPLIGNCQHQSHPMLRCTSSDYSDAVDNLKGTLYFLILEEYFASLGVGIELRNKGAVETMPEHCLLLGSSGTFSILNCMIDVTNLEKGDQRVRRPVLLQAIQPCLELSASHRGHSIHVFLGLQKNLVQSDCLLGAGLPRQVFSSPSSVLALRLQLGCDYHIVNNYSLLFGRLPYPHYRQMSLLKQCFSSQNVDIINQRKWYKIPNGKASLKGSIYTKKLSNSPTDPSVPADQPGNGRMSHFYNQRSPGKTLMGDIGSSQSEMQRLRQENIQLKMVIRNELEPLKIRCDHLLEDNKTKSNIIASLESRLGLGGPNFARQRPF